ncbi:MAG: GNAT family N-acetyltransferase [Candidatus Thorarchaeota archaeon SMTZ1-45]|nr:MAG: hypothetical protein AM325_10640 [Candidatus Thorarchaeota archaeon SMTZ1-45]
MRRRKPLFNILLLVLSMIKEIEFDKIDDIAPILDLYRERYGENSLAENFIEQIKTSVSNDKTSLFGTYDKNEILKGIGFFGKASARILLVFADGNMDLEKELLGALCNRFQKEYSHIATGGAWIPWISAPLSQHLIEIGFVKYDRAHMTLDKNAIEELDEPILPAGMSFEVYSRSNRNEISELIFRGNDGSVDQDVFPDFFGSLENCMKMVEDIEGDRYGEYKDGSSWILRFDCVIIGACFMTCMDGATGYIPDIVIEPEHRGKGLGRALLIHSMKRQIESNTTICKTDLDVTFSNTARYLYESLGFSTVEEYAMYTLKS